LTLHYPLDLFFLIQKESILIIALGSIQQVEALSGGVIFANLYLVSGIRLALRLIPTDQSIKLIMTKSILSGQSAFQFNIVKIPLGVVGLRSLLREGRPCCVPI